ncbi:hypothetical protein BDN72DRAFT_839969 [Pluteus cervinus]|uniref:Uncharacterized protein n=1 Tax=Pluteus cervinus TaxID=181527 RepID=A0ACD3AW42_9AGAR|nr:hypothetical protein BDN72DRAFT_839969 [Pluteus cervinus]
MHSFGGTPRCPRCSNAVYAAEQVMGPGRKLYHKPCLACTSCNKRLDSYTLLEHDQKPYCKPCHVKNFGTRDLRQANLPQRDESLFARPPSPTKFTDTRATSPVRAATTGNTPPLHLRPTRSLGPNPTIGSPTKRVFPRSNTGAMRTQRTASPDEIPSPTPENEEPEGDEPISHIGRTFSPGPTNTGRPGLGGIPRTVPLSPTRTSFEREAVSSEDTLPDLNGPTQYTSFANSRPLVPMATGPSGTRYGAALGTSVSVNMTGGSPRRWGAATPTCPKCGKNVYFAEQVKAVGKTYHKGCLRCTECNTSLDSNKLRDHDDQPFCVRCYSKLHGPQGGGYALLGKAGG